MPSQISKAGQNFLINGALTTGVVYFGTALLSGDSMIPDPALIGFGLTAGAMLLARTRSRKSPSRWGQMASVTRIAPAHPDMNSYQMKWKPEPEPEEFVFSGLGLPVSVHESSLHRFLGIARRRQTNALYGGAQNMVWSGEGFRRIKINWVLSEAHFTKRVRPRFPEVEYVAIVDILTITGLIVKGSRIQGSSGYLVGDYGVGRYVDIARRRWAHLTAAPPRRNLPNFFRYFYH